MKKYSNLSTFILLLIVLSCGKREITGDMDENIDPAVIYTKLIGPWKITGFIDASGKDYYNTTMPDCEKDNIITYLNSYVTVTHGALKCNSAYTPPVSAKFDIGGLYITTFAGNTSTNLERFKILLLNETTFKIKGTISNNVITYTRQANVVVLNPIVGTWLQTGATMKGHDVWNSSYTFATASYTETHGPARACEKDDLVTFTNDNLIIYDEGSSKCNAVDPQISISTWDISADRRHLFVKEKDNYVQDCLIEFSNDFKILYVTTDDGYTGIYSKLP